MASVQTILAKSNIRKRKSSAATLFLLILVAILLLNIGLSVTLKMNSFQQQKLMELKTPDLISYLPSDEHLKDYESLLSSYEYTGSWESEPALLLSDVKTDYGGSETTVSLLILDKDRQRSMAPFQAILPLENASSSMLIYLPYMFHLSAGYNPGDSISLTKGTDTYTYTVGGFIEDPLLGTFNYGAAKVFMSAQAYKDLEERTGHEAEYRFMSANLTDTDKVEKLNQLLGERISASGTHSLYSVISADSGIAGNRFFASILSAILIVFSLLMVVISLIVIRFQILGHIEDHLLNIGVLKANGYTSRQIAGSLLLQFSWISLAAAIPGLVLSSAAMPLAGNQISVAVGLIWPYTFQPLSALLSLAVISGTVLLVAYLSSRRVQHISPITALQSGMLNHNFSRNRIPLEQTRLPLQLALSLKALFRQAKQNVMMIIIVAGLTFSCIFCTILNFNFTGDTSAMFKLVGLENSNLRLVLNNGPLTPELIHEVEQIPGVSKITNLDSLVASIQDTGFLLNISDNFDTMETQTVYKGRQPEFDNEIAVSGLIARQLGKTIGDEVSVTVGGAGNNYLITGLSQQINQLGMVATMTEAGLKRTLPDYSPSSLNVYLRDDSGADAFVSQLEQRFPEQWTVTNITDLLNSTLRTFSTAISSLTLLISLVTVLVVSLILYLVIKTLILKRKKEYGILKGVGFTSFNLMLQITLSLLPVVAIGVAGGCLAGYFFSDTALVALLSSLGIYNVQLAVNLPQLLLAGIAVIAVAFIVSMVVSYRIRKISVYSLISD